MAIKRGDTVMVTTGKDRGKKGKVERVLPKQERVIVGGLNVIKRHAKPSRRYPSGGIMEISASIHQSNVKRVDEAAEKTGQTNK